MDGSIKRDASSVPSEMSLRHVSTEMRDMRNNADMQRAKVVQKRRRRATARRLERCGMCAKVVRECRCEDDELTESVASILAACRGLAGTRSKQHMCMWVYHEYRRWSTRCLKSLYSPELLPPLEGWVQCWVRPFGSRPRRVSGIADAVLNVVLVYHDGSSQFAYVTSKGELIALAPAATPRHGVYLEAAHARLEMRVIPVARTLSLADVRSGIRGAVLAADARPHNAGRVVSHVVREEPAERFVLQRIPATSATLLPELVSLPQSTVRLFCPMLAREFEWRQKRRYSKTGANFVLPFIESLCARAVADDLAAVEALTPILDRTAPESVIGSITKMLDELHTVMAKSTDG